MTAILDMKSKKEIIIKKKKRKKEIYIEKILIYNRMFVQGKSVEPAVCFTDQYACE